MAENKKKILVVDDNEVVLKTVSLKLQGCGYQVITALDGTEAVASARKDPPDLILLDISFPPDVDGVPWDGFRIMEWFHRLDPAKKVPVIVITGFLGAGKTTLVRHLMQNPQGRRLAILVNEFGDLGIDGDILKGCADADCPEDAIVELTNGCLCCRSAF